MSRLVDDLLSLARSDAGTWTIARETVDMDALLLETAELFCPVARQKGQRLLLEVPERDLPFFYSPARTQKSHCYSLP